MMKYNISTSAKIMVIGDIMLDHYIHGSCVRISPEAPVQVVDIAKESYTLGGAGNVFQNLNAFGCKSAIICVSGDDEGSQIIEDHLDYANPYFYRLIKDNSRRTTIKTRVLANRHQLIRLDREDKHVINPGIANSIVDSIKSKIAEIDVLILSDYCKGSLSNELLTKVIALCRTHGVISIVDSKDKNLSKYYGATIIKPNKTEASYASGINIVDDDTLRKACEKIAADTGCESVVVTLSEDGIAIYNNNTLTKTPTKALEVIDVTGAGDTVIAALAFGLSNRLSITDACDFANHAAAIVVGKVGSAVATIDEINNLIEYDQRTIE